MKSITVAEFLSAYSSRAKAAEAINVSRQTLYDWESKHKGKIPDPWCYKAQKLIEEFDEQNPTKISPRRRPT